MTDEDIDTTTLEDVDGEEVEVPRRDVWAAIDINLIPGVYLSNANGELVTLHDEAGEGDLNLLAEYVEEHIDGVSVDTCIEEGSLLDVGPLTVPSSPPAWLWAAFGIVWMATMGFSGFPILHATVGSLALGVALGEVFERERC